MNSFDNIRHDISDASFCITTAIELLSGIEQDGGAQSRALRELIARLMTVKDELEDAHQRVAEVEQQIPV